MTNPTDYASFESFSGRWNFDHNQNNIVLDPNRSFNPNTDQFELAGNDLLSFQDTNTLFNNYPETAQVPYHEFDMTTVEVASGSQIEDANSDLTCTFSECHQDTAFQTQSALDKHIQKKHLKPFACTIPSCKHPHFGDKSGLKRHKREVHSPQNFPCPITTCKRHIKGFNRAYNLHDHMKRCHPQSSRGGSMLLPLPATSNYHGSEERTEESDEIMSPRSETSGDILPGRWHGEKLERLRKFRDEIEDDIQALERTMEMMNER